MDTFFLDTPALDDGITGHAGCTMVQLYNGLTSHLTEVFPMHTMEELSDTLNAFIIKHGAPNAIRSDNHKAQLSCKVKDILCYLYIGHSTSEPEQQNQNPAE